MTPEHPASASLYPVAASVRRRAGLAAICFSLVCAWIGDPLPATASTTGIHASSVTTSVKRAITRNTPNTAASAWSIIGSPNASSGDNVLYGTACASATNCWAVGYYIDTNSIQQTLIEQGTGGGWAIISGPIPGNVAQQLQGITCVNASDCWAVGDYYTSTGQHTLIEHYDGAGWTLATSQSGAGQFNDLYGVSCASANDCWAAGYYDPTGIAQTLTEHFNGSSWSIVPSVDPNPGGGSEFSAISCVSASDCWAVGWYGDTAGHRQTLIEKYAGSSWSLVSSPDPQVFSDQLSSVSCAGVSDCLAVGNASDAVNTSPLYFQNTGSGWTNVGGPAPSNNVSINAVTCVSASDCWSVGTSTTSGGGGIQLMLQNTGSGWAIAPSPSSPNIDLVPNALTCVSATDCWAVGDYPNSGAYQTLIEQYAPLSQKPLIGGPVLLGEVLGATNCSCPNPHLGHLNAGDPVDTAYGNYTETYTDVAIPGRSAPLQFARTYNALAANTGGSLGFGWTDNAVMALNQPGGTGPVTVTQEGGAQTVFNQNGTTYTPAAPRDVATLVHNGDSTWTFVRGARDTFTFSAAGKLTGAVDLNGYRTTYAYNGGGQLSSVTDSAGRSLTLRWTGSHVTSLTDANVTPSRTVSYQYNDGNGNLTDVIDANGGHTHYVYDSAHHLTNVLDPNCEAVGAACNAGQGRVNHYDPQGRVSWQQDQLGRQTNFAYTGDPTSASGGVTTVTDPKGNVTAYSYQYGVLTKQTRGYGTSFAASSEYTYDPATASLASTTDPNGNLVLSTYDSSGNQLSSVDALGRQTSATYNAFNEPLTQTDGTNVTTSYSYDGKGNLTSVSRPLIVNNQYAATRKTTYNYTDSTHPGDVITMIDPDGFNWTYGYDTYGNRTSSTDPVGDKSSTTFNADGWKLTSVSPRGNVTGCNCASQYTTTYGYIDTVSHATNGFGDVTSVTDPLGHVTASHYDGDRNLTSSTDGDGNTTSYTFDLANERTVTTRADHTTTRTDYNSDGTIADQKDGKSNSVLTFAYDPLARISSQTDALGNTTSFTYDGAGNQLTRQDPGGNCIGTPPTGCTVMGYDAANEVISVTYSDGITPAVSAILYDGDGQRTSMTDGTGTSTWVWDTLHELTSYTDGHHDVVQYQYNDLRGLVTVIIYPDNRYVTRGYDNAGRWTSVQDSPNTTTFGYNPDGELTTKTFPASSGVVDTTVPNAAGQATSISSVKGTTTLFSATYTQDNNGQVTSDTSVASATRADRYTPLNQLCYAGSASTTVCSSPPSGAQVYVSDAADNLTSNKGATQSFNAADQLCWTITGSSANSCTSAPTGATSYTYNSRGDRTKVSPASGSSTTLTFDQKNQMTGWTQGSSSATYAYDGDGLRTSKTVSGVATMFTWDESGSVPMLIGDGTSDYVYGPTGLLEQATRRPTISLVGTAAISGQSSTLKLTFPAGVQASDQVFVASTEPSTTTVTAPTGYTSVASVTSGGTSPKATTTVFRHTVASGETSVTLTYSSGSTAQSAVLTDYRGIDASMPVDVSSTGSAAAATTVSAPSLSVVHANDQLLLFQGAAGTFATSTWTAPGGMTERAQVNSTANVSSGLADQALGAAGSTGARTSSFGKSANLTAVMVAVSPPPSVLFYHEDLLGSTRLLTDVLGTVRGSFTYDSYGNLAAATGSYTTPFGFSGEYKDAETGLIYLRARYYDPITAQFLTRDPAAAVTLSPYAYVTGNPLNVTDPTGLKVGAGTQCQMLTGAARVACIKKTEHDLKAAAQRLEAAVHAVEEFVNNNVFGVCLNVSGGAGIGFMGSACFAFNAHSIGFTGTFGAGVEIPGGAGGGIGPMFAAGARNVRDLGDGFVYGGASAGVGPGGGLDISSGTGSCGQQVTVIQPWFGGAYGVSGHAGASNTWVWSP